MRRTNIFIIIILSFSLIFCLTNGDIEAKDKIRKQLSAEDLSTPEKSVFYFYEAFRIGDDNLLSQVLAESAIMSEFNPEQKITVPNPYILGAEIKKIHFIKKDMNTDIILNDVLVYTKMKIDEKIKTPYRGMAMLGYNLCFLLRKVDGKWLIKIVYPDWPEFEFNKK